MEKSRERIGSCGRDGGGYLPVSRRFHPTEGPRPRPRPPQRPAGRRARRYGASGIDGPGQILLDLGGGILAKGSVRKKGKKWYYRFYVEDASGNLVQKECVGTESKSETEKLLRQAMDDYEKKKFVAKAENLTVGQLLDVWAEEELKTGTLSNGTVENYLGTIRNIKKHPLAERKLKNVTSEHLQSFFDLLSFGGVHPDGKERKGYSKDYIHSFSAVMQQSFRFAVFPKQYMHKIQSFLCLL